MLTGLRPGEKHAGGPSCCENSHLSTASARPSLAFPSRQRTGPVPLQAVHPMSLVGRCSESRATRKPGPAREICLEGFTPPAFSSSCGPSSTQTGEQRPAGSIRRSSQVSSSRNCLLRILPAAFLGSSSTATARLGIL